MQLAGFYRLVWAATFGGHILLLVVLFVRHRAGSFPAFTTFIAEETTATIVRFFLSRHVSFNAYLLAYRSLDILNEVLQLFVFYELAVHVFCPTGVWARDVYKTFVGLVVASTVVDLLLTLLARPSAYSWIQMFILRSNFFSALLMSELFVGMVVLSTTEGLSWKTHVARIAQGMGAYSMVCVAKDIVLNYVTLDQHLRVDTELSHLRVLTYLGCEVFWIVMLWQEAPAPRELPESMRTQIYALHKRVEYDLIRIRDWRNK
jgi:hypothetical protein